MAVLTMNGTPSWAATPCSNPGFLQSWHHASLLLTKENTIDNCAFYSQCDPPRSETNLPLSLASLCWGTSSGWVMWFWLRTSYKTQEDSLGRKWVWDRERMDFSYCWWDMPRRKTEGVENFSLGRLRERRKADGWQIGIFYAKQAGLLAERGYAEPWGQMAGGQQAFWSPRLHVTSNSKASTEQPHKDRKR